MSVQLQPIPPPEEARYHRGIDPACNMSWTTQGFLHIVVIVCYLTKFVIDRSLRTKTSREIPGCPLEINLFWSFKYSPTWPGARILEQGKTMIDVTIVHTQIPYLLYFPFLQPNEEVNQLHTIYLISLLLKLDLCVCVCLFVGLY